MQSFLDKTATYILENYTDTKNLTVILPNRRAALYLKKHLAKKITKPIFCPEIFSIEDFIIKISGFEIADNFSLLLEFYKAYCEVELQNSKSFDEVFKWAKQVLKDYNEIDISLVDSDKIFIAVTEAAIIKTWNLGAPLTEHQKRYVYFYQSLGKYYTVFVQNLLNKKYAYQGLVYRKAAENIDNLIKTFDNEKFIFAGLNALTPAEEKIIFTLYNQGFAQLLWDADKYYVNNDLQEAGAFIRNYKLNINNEFLWLEDNIVQNPKTIHITATQGKVLQAKYAGNIIEQFVSENENINDIALVLADENLLFPVLNSLPENLKHFNITMGIPLGQLPAAEVLESVLRIHLNAKINNNKELFFTDDILLCFEHPYIFKLFGEDAINIIKKLRSTAACIDENKICSFTENEHSIELIKIIVSQWNDNPSMALRSFKKLNTELMKIFLADNSNRKIEYEYFYYLNRSINNFENIIKTFNIKTGIKTFYSLFKYALNSIRLPFYGEPLSGLQIMGLLETRTLDFKKIILLSANEGILPADKSEPTFIPFDVRKSFGMKHIREKYAVYAYHFYRLLHHCNEMYIIYNTQQDALSTNEKSRFLQQIEYELPKLNPNIKILNNIFTLNDIKTKNIKNISITKDNNVLNNIKARVVSGLFPTALNNYIACPLKFYYSEIACIPETDEIYDINYARFGSIVHEVLNNLYLQLIGKCPSPEILQQMHKNVKNITSKVLNTNYQNIDITSGKNLLAYKAIIRMVENYLLYEENRLKKKSDGFIIYNLESILTYKTSLNINGKDIEIMIKGKPDRIETNGSVVRILDYKTGKTENRELKVDSEEGLTKNPELAKAFQLLMYAYLFNKNENFTANQFELGIISIAAPGEGIKKTCFKENYRITSNDLQSFEKVIFQIANELFNTEIPFTQTENREICKYCPYNTICGYD